MLQAKFPTPQSIHLGSMSALSVNHDNVVVRELTLDGALVIEGAEETEIVVDGLRVQQEQGWEWRALEDDSSAEEHERIR